MTRQWIRTSRCWPSHASWEWKSKAHISGGGGPRAKHDKKSSRAVFYEYSPVCLFSNSSSHTLDWDTHITDRIDERRRGDKERDEMNKWEPERTMRHYFVLSLRDRDYTLLCWQQTGFFFSSSSSSFHSIVKGIFSIRPVVFLIYYS